jgi:polysaccharide biosynthesis transport protein
MNTDIDQIDRKASKPFDPVGTVKIHWMEIAVFGSILLILSIPCAFILSKPYYTVQGRILVAPAVSTLIVQNEETPITGYYNDYVRTNVSRLKKREVFEKALSKLEPELKSRFIPKNTSLSFAVTLLLNNVEINHLEGTHLISITLTDKKPTGIAELVNNIADVYMEEIQKEMETKDYRRLMYLQNEKEKIEEDITAQDRLLQEIAKETGTFSFTDENNIYSTQLESLQEEYIRVYSDRVLKESSLSSLQNVEKYRKKAKIKPLVDELMNQGSSSTQLNNSTHQELINLKSAIEGYLPEHPDRVKIEDKIKSLENSLKKLETEDRKKTEGIVSEKLNLELDEKLINARADYDAAKKAEDEIRVKRDEVLADRAKISQKLISGKQIGEKILHLRGLLNRIEDRISELTLESKAPGRLQVESYAKSPELPSGSNLKKILIIFLLFSYGSIMMICIIYDLFDGRIRDRKNILNALGSHPSWPISNYKFTGTGRTAFSWVTMEDSSNVVAKAIQSLAVRIDKERKEHDARCVVFTGIDKRCGTTEILLNTAYAITKLCKNIIIIDANFDHPNIGNLINTDTGKPGIIDFLIKDIPISDCIVHDEVRGMDFILPGRAPTSDELSLMDLSTIPQMIQELKQRYTLIIIDCSPVLTSDLTEYCILQSDIAITVMQGDKTKYEDLYLAGDILFRLKVPAIGAVLNWGAPRNLNKVQLLISKFLWPLEKFLTRFIEKEPKYVRYFVEPSTSPELGSSP